MPDGEDQVDVKLLRRVLGRPLGAGVFLLLLGWTFYIALSVFSFDIGSWSKITEESYAEERRARIYFYFAMVCTATAVFGGGFVALAYTSVIKRGAKVAGTYLSRGSGAYNGMTDVTVQFELNGKRYKHRESVNVAVLQDLNQGDPVLVLVSPRWPKWPIVVWERLDVATLSARS